MSGKLNPGADPVRTFIDTFPAGTLSGASRRVEVRIRFSSMKCRYFMDTWHPPGMRHLPPARHTTPQGRYRE